MDPELVKALYESVYHKYDNAKKEVRPPGVPAGG